MGNVISDQVQFDCGVLDTWKLAHVQRLKRMYVDENMDFGITRPDFKVSIRSQVHQLEHTNTVLPVLTN